MKFTTFAAKAANPILNSLLNRVTPGFSSIYARNFSSSTGDDLVKYTHMMNMDSGDVEKVAQTLQSKIKTLSTSGASSIDLRNAKAMKAASYDVEVSEGDDFGQILLGSADGISVRYGKAGITPSKDVSVDDLLNQELLIPRNSFGVLSIKNHVPFSIKPKNLDQTFAIAASALIKVDEYDRAKIEKMGSLEKVLSLPEDIARMVHIKLQERIFSDRNNEKFHEEVTSIVDKPTEYNRSSGTLMNFERRRFGADNTTDSHYHPGDRRLHIFTLGKEAGVTLNFCGISENPHERKDCEVRLDFPESSMVVLKFPAYTHHKFHGDFACISVHPIEGQNILEAVQSGTLKKGFLETATVFSPSKEGHEKMKNLVESANDNGNKSKSPKSHTV